MNVLIADDSGVVRERLAAMLSELPDVVVAAETTDVTDTMEAIRQLHPEVVVLDLSMPGGSGLDVLRLMSVEHLTAMVIVLTNYPYPEYEQIALAQGAAAFLDKSHEFMKVVDLVRDFRMPVQREMLAGVMGS